MKRVAVLLIFASLFAISPLPSLSQTAPSTGSNATGVVSSISNAVWGGATASSIQLSGNAIWTAGSNAQQGTVTISADRSGNSSLQITGGMDRLETETAIGSDRSCQWTGADGQVNTADYLNCLKPMEWLFPPLTLQPNLMPSSVGVVDLGLSQFSVGTLRHLQAQNVIAAMPSGLLSQSMQRSTMDLGVNPTTFLPADLTYVVHPDSGAPVDISIEIRYSDYRKVGNAQIPFRIQRYINGALQLDIQINSATLS